MKKSRLYRIFCFCLGVFIAFNFISPSVAVGSNQSIAGCAVQPSCQPLLRLLPGGAAQAGNASGAASSAVQLTVINGGQATTTTATGLANGVRGFLTTNRNGLLTGGTFLSSLGLIALTDSAAERAPGAEGTHSESRVFDFPVSFNIRDGDNRVRAGFTAFGWQLDTITSGDNTSIAVRLIDSNGNVTGIRFTLEAPARVADVEAVETSEPVEPDRAPRPDIERFEDLTPQQREELIAEVIPGFDFLPFIEPLPINAPEGGFVEFSEDMVVVDEDGNSEILPAGTPITAEPIVPEEDPDADTDPESDPESESEPDTGLQECDDSLSLIPFCEVEIEPSTSDEFEIEPQTFERRQWYLHMAETFQGRFPFDVLGDLSLPSNEPLCPQLVVFGQTQELCAISDAFSVLRWPAIVGFIIRLFIAL